MRVVFIGTGEIGLPVLRWLLGSKEHELVGVVTQPDKPAGRDQRIQAPPIKAALADVAIPILQPERIKRDDAVGAIAGWDADVIVVMAYGQILPRAVLDLSHIACLNLHASLLPRYRGAAPIQAAIMSGDSETGITVMYMDEGLDTGDILLQSRIAIAGDETGGSLHDRLAEIAPATLKDSLEQLGKGIAPRVPQDSAQATHAPKLEREDGRIEWGDSAEVIERKIRAFDPWPGSFGILRGPAGPERKLKFFRASVVHPSRLQPGELAVSSEEIFVGAGRGALRLDAVQLEGKKRMTAADLLRGHEWLSQAALS